MTGIEESRTFLPWWVVWGPLVVRLPLAFAISFLVASLASIISGWPLRRAAGLPWMERARLAYPARIPVRQMCLLLILISTFFVSYFGGQLCPISNGLLAILMGLASYGGSAIAFFFGERRIRQGRYTFAEWISGLLLYWLLFAPLLLMALIFIPLMPRTFDVNTIFLFAAAVATIMFFGVGGGLFIARILGLMNPAPQHVRDLVEEVSRGMGVHVRSVYLMSLPVAQAVALPLLKCVAFTPKTLDILNDDELSAVCAHELGHLSESWFMLAGRLAFL
jgi:Zn-dependent protease with chaperone function